MTFLHYKVNKKYLNYSKKSIFIFRFFFVYLHLVGKK